MRFKEKQMTQAMPILRAFDSETKMHQLSDLTVHEFYAMIKAQLKEDELKDFEASWPTLGTQP